MTDMEQLIWDLKFFKRFVPKDSDKDKALDNAIARLKKQEGYWRVLTDCSNSGVYCSECRTKIFEYTTPPKKKLSQFCPHCGAKMAPWDQAVWS